MDTAFGWAIIGCGGIARNAAMAILQSGGKIISVWNRTKIRAEEFSARYGGAVYETARDAILAPGVEGVYIALTANLHAEYMMLCIECGKPVLCEKPFTVNAAQAEAVLALARQRKVYVAEAMWTWFNATAKQVKHWVQEGYPGKIRNVYGTYSFPMLKSPLRKPRHTSPEMIGGALLDTGVYGLRYCYELFGMPKQIYCAGRIAGGIDLGEEITLFYDSFKADFIFSRDQNHGETFIIFGEKGKITVPAYHCARKAVMKGMISAKTKDASDLFMIMFDRTAREIRSGCTEPEISRHQSTLDVMTIMDECRRQMGLKYPCEEE